MEADIFFPTQIVSRILWEGKASLLKVEKVTTQRYDQGLVGINLGFQKVEYNRITPVKGSNL